MGKSGTLARFCRLAEKVEQFEIEAQASAELLQVASGDTDIENEFAKLEDKWSAENALAGLKAKIEEGRLLPSPTASS